MTDKKTEAEAVAEIVHENARVPRAMSLEAPDGVDHPILLLPSAGNTWTASSVKKLMDEYRWEPERRKGTANLTEVESFIAHVNRFKDEDSAIFVAKARPRPSLLAVLDYHRATSEGSPRFGEHKAYYPFPISDAWEAWGAKDGEEFGQSEFAQFIEDNLADVAVPEVARESARAQTFMGTFKSTFAGPEKLLALSRGLTVHVGEKVEQAVNPSTGEVSLRFESQHNTNQVQMPTAFILTIPVFKEGTVYIVVARFRYRVRAGAVTFWYNLHKPEEIFDDAIRGVVETVKAATELPIFAGSPEA